MKNTNNNNIEIQDNIIKDIISDLDLKRNNFEISQMSECDDKVIISFTVGEVLYNIEYFDTLYTKDSFPFGEVTKPSTTQSSEVSFEETLLVYQILLSKTLEIHHYVRQRREDKIPVRESLF